MSEKVLNRPTVADLIDILLEYHPDMKVVIEDADTDWIIDKIHIGPNGHAWNKYETDTLVLWGTYPEMHSCEESTLDD